MNGGFEFVEVTATVGVFVGGVGEGGEIAGGEVGVNIGVCVRAGVGIRAGVGVGVGVGVALGPVQLPSITTRTRRLTSTCLTL